MANYIYKQVVCEMRRLIVAAWYIALTLDKLTTVDNSYLSVHVYFVEDGFRAPLLVSLERVDCTPNAKNLTKLIIDAVSTGGIRFQEHCV